MYASGRCWEFLFYATWGRHAATMTKARGNSAAASTIAIVRKGPDGAGRNNNDAPDSKSRPSGELRFNSASLDPAFSGLITSISNLDSNVQFTDWFVYAA